MKGGITLCSNEQKVNTRDKVANDLGMSSTMLGKAEFVHNNANEEIILLSVHIEPLEKEYQIQAEKNMRKGGQCCPTLENIVLKKIKEIGTI